MSINPLKVNIRTDIDSIMHYLERKRKILRNIKGLDIIAKYTKCDLYKEEASTQRIRHGLIREANPINMLTLEGEFIQTFMNCKDAALACGLLQNSINRVCLGECKSHGGFRWEYKDHEKRIRKKDRKEVT